MKKFAECVYILCLALLAPCLGESEETTVLAIYFPQYHEDALNNKLWGNGFTDWDRVKQHKVNKKGKLIPQPTDLGYYDLANPMTRQWQGDLAREYGIDGFMYYHYWFDNIGPVLHTTLEKMLLDGKPNRSFAFIWANEDWHASWHGASTLAGGVLVEQTYNTKNASSTLAHYNFLRRFFHHPNYIKVHGAPLFLPYKVSKHQFMPKALKRILRYMKLLNQYAIEDGFTGLHTPYPSIFSEHELYKPGNIESDVSTVLHFPLHL